MKATTDYQAAYQAVEMAFASLRSENVQLLAQVNRYRSALEYYADAGNVREIAMIDRGQKAREALK